MLARWKALWADESGQGLVEYGLILALVAVFVIGALVLMRDQIVALFNEIANTLQNRGAPQ